MQYIGLAITALINLLGLAYFSGRVFNQIQNLAVMVAKIEARMDKEESEMIGRIHTLRRDFDGQIKDLRREIADKMRDERDSRKP